MSATIVEIEEWRNRPGSSVARGAKRAGATLTQHTILEGLEDSRYRERIKRIAALLAPYEHAPYVITLVMSHRTLGPVGWKIMSLMVPIRACHLWCWSDGNTLTSKDEDRRFDADDLEGLRQTLEQVLAD